MREWLSGGAPPCQGGGRGFDSRLALFLLIACNLISGAGVYQALRGFFHGWDGTCMCLKIVCFCDLGNILMKCYSMILYLLSEIMLKISILILITP